MALFKVFKGLSKKLTPELVPYRDGHTYFCTDDTKWWIDFETAAVGADGNPVLERKYINQALWEELQSHLPQMDENDILATQKWADEQGFIKEESLSFTEWTENLIINQIDLSGSTIYFDTSRNWDNDRWTVGSTIFETSGGYKLSIISGPPNIKLFKGDNVLNNIYTYPQTWLEYITLPEDFGYIISFNYHDNSAVDTCSLLNLITTNVDTKVTTLNKDLSVYGYATREWVTENSGSNYAKLDSANIFTKESSSFTINPSASTALYYKGTYNNGLRIENSMGSSNSNATEYENTNYRVSYIEHISYNNNHVKGTYYLQFPTIPSSQASTEIYNLTLPNSTGTLATTAMTKEDALSGFGNSSVTYTGTNAVTSTVSLNASQNNFLYYKGGPGNGGQIKIENASGNSDSTGTEFNNTTYGRGTIANTRYNNNKKKEVCRLNFPPVMSVTADTYYDLYLPAESGALATISKVTELINANALKDLTNYSGNGVNINSTGEMILSATDGLYIVGDENNGVSITGPVSCSDLTASSLFVSGSLGKSMSISALKAHLSTLRTNQKIIRIVPIGPTILYDYIKKGASPILTIERSNAIESTFTSTNINGSTIGSHKYYLCIDSRNAYLQYTYSYIEVGSSPVTGADNPVTLNLSSDNCVFYVL